MYKVYFENSNQVWRKIAEGSKEDCSKAVNDFLKKNNYKSYYTNVVMYDVGVEIWDVGSYTEFFWIIDCDTATQLPDRFERVG